MLHPSYTDLMAVVNSEVEPGEQPVVQSRYSIVMATSKRARQIIAGENPLVSNEGKKPLSIAVDELYYSKVRIVGDEEEEEELTGKATSTLKAEKDTETMEGEKTEATSEVLEETKETEAEEEII